MKVSNFLPILGLLFNISVAMAAATGPVAGRPHEHFCPITLDVMQDPVVALDGHIYERNAIAEHFRYSDKSPVTGVRIAKTLTPVHFVKAMIRKDWVFFLGFSWAFIGLPQIIKSSFRAQKDFTKSDHEVLEEFIR